MISKQAAGMGLTDIKICCRPVSVCFQPISVGGGSSAMNSWNDTVGIPPEHGLIMHSHQVKLQRIRCGWQSLWFTLLCQHNLFV
jgi:hypothetical protein